VLYKIRWAVVLANYLCSITLNQPLRWTNSINTNISIHITTVPGEGCGGHHLFLFIYNLLVNIFIWNRHHFMNMTRHEKSQDICMKMDQSCVCINTAGSPNYEVKSFRELKEIHSKKKNIPTNYWTVPSDLWAWINKDKSTESQRGGSWCYQMSGGNSYAHVAIPSGCSGLSKTVTEESRC